MAQAEGYMTFLGSSSVVLGVSAWAMGPQRGRAHLVGHVPSQETAYCGQTVLNDDTTGADTTLCFDDGK